MKRFHQKDTYETGFKDMYETVSSKKIRTKRFQRYVWNGFIKKIRTKRFQRYIWNGFIEKICTKQVSRICMKRFHQKDMDKTVSKTHMKRFHQKDTYKTVSSKRYVQNGFKDTHETVSSKRYVWNRFIKRSAWNNICHCLGSTAFQEYKYPPLPSKSCSQPAIQTHPSLFSPPTSFFWDWRST